MQVTKWLLPVRMPAHVTLTATVPRALPIPLLALGARIHFQVPRLVRPNVEVEVKRLRALLHPRLPSPPRPL